MRNCFLNVYPGGGIWFAATGMPKLIRQSEKPEYNSNFDVARWKKTPGYLFSQIKKL